MAKKSYSQPVDINGRPIKGLSAWKKKNPKRLYFDSKFEWECYKLLRDAKFHFDFHPETRTVMEGFKSWALSKGKVRKLNRSTVRPITYTSDFAVYCNDGTTVFIEAKGFFHKDARMRYKLFQASLSKDEVSLLAFDKQDNLRDMKAIIKIIEDHYGGSSIDGKQKARENKITRI